jgi:adenylosuccinate lyase
MLGRYTLPEMQQLWETENRYRKWLDVEILACEAWAELGKIPTAAVEAIKERATIDVRRIDEIEAVVRHDVIAFVSSVAESVGEEGKYIHMGLTSYDVVDTALSLLMRDALDLILQALDQLRGLVGDKARQYKDTPMIGRTHSVHAEPITLGLKFALWYAELGRDRERLLAARRGIAVGRLAGVVGTFAHIDPYVEQYVCRKLGLEPAPITTQVLQRDRHAEYLTALAITAGSLEKFATEIRHLQRTEVLELEEGFAPGQKGSSAMPHKRNPVGCEQICGLARVLRGNAQAAMENANLWHERDISNSSVERIIVPDSTTLLHYLLVKFRQIMKQLNVYPEHMQKNLERTHGLIYSQRLLLALIGKGLRREEAYTLVQDLAMANWPDGDFLEAVKADAGIGRYLSRQEIEGICSVTDYLRRVDYLFWRAGLADPPVNSWEKEIEVARTTGAEGPEGTAELHTATLKGQFLALPERLEQLYEGKAKRVYRTSAPDLYWIEYKDDATAFDGLKKSVIPGKGRLNNLMAAHFFTLLERAGVPTHFVKLIDDHQVLVKAVEIVPLEVIVRNIAAGSLAKRLGLEEGRVLLHPSVEFSYKDDALHDPLVTEDQITSVGWATKEMIADLRRQALLVNQVLRTYLRSKKLELVDFKLEFGTQRGELLLADEISPDTCRFWDLETREKLDKDRFRRDLGDLIPAYEEVWRRLQGDR